MGPRAVVQELGVFPQRTEPNRPVYAADVTRSHRRGAHAHSPQHKTACCCGPEAAPPSARPARSAMRASPLSCGVEALQAERCRQGGIKGLMLMSLMKPRVQASVTLATNRSGAWRR